jgi:hypothetical protein
VDTLGNTVALLGICNLTLMAFFPGECCKPAVECAYRPTLLSHPAKAGVVQLFSLQGQKTGTQTASYSAG